MKIPVIGAGYVGLTTAACLAEIRHCVCCADNEEAKPNLLHAGRVPFFEPHLEALVSRNRSRRLQFATPENALDGAEVIFICVVRLRSTMVRGIFRR